MSAKKSKSIVMKVEAQRHAKNLTVQIKKKRRTSKCKKRQDVSTWWRRRKKEQSLCKNCWKKQTRKQKRSGQRFGTVANRPRYHQERKHTHEMLRGHDLWRMIKCERTRAWCRRCAGHAERNCGKLLKQNCRGQTEPERDRSKSDMPICKRRRGSMIPARVLKTEGSNAKKKSSMTKNTNEKEKILRIKVFLHRSMLVKDYVSRAQVKRKKLWKMKTDLPFTEENKTPEKERGTLANLLEKSRQKLRLKG